MPLVPAARHREWMDKTQQRFAYRCLPMVISNQAGWWLLSPMRIKARWSGEPGTDAIEVRHDGAYAQCPALSHFGEGVLTWHIPYLFRTEPGWNLRVTGPSNYPRNGICYLEGIVETDWSPATFTMNWLFTNDQQWIEILPGEPICQIAPERRGELENVEPEIRALASEPKELGNYLAWDRSRSNFLVEQKTPGTPGYVRGWQKDYFQGREFPEHQTRLELKEFKRET